MTFAYPISLVIAFMVFTIYLGLLIGLYVWFDMNFFILSLIFLASILLFAGLMRLKTKSKFKTWYAESIISSIAAIYQSNLGKWFSIFYGIGIFGFATPIIISDVRDFSLFQSERGLNDFEEEWPAKNHHYLDQHGAEKRIPRAFISSEEIADNYLRVGIARYESDHKVIQDLNKQFKKSLDSLGWKKLENSGDLHRIYLNDSLIKVNNWSKNRLAVSGQKVYQAGMDISHLENGIHEIRIEKLLLIYGFLDNEPEIKLREDWSVFTFVKK
jgi:hypothetical protein